MRRWGSGVPQRTALPPVYPSRVAPRPHAESQQRKHQQVDVAAIEMWRASGHPRCAWSSSRDNARQLLQDGRLSLRQARPGANRRACRTGAFASATGIATAGGAAAVTAGRAAATEATAAARRRPARPRRREIFFLRSRKGVGDNMIDPQHHVALSRVRHIAHRGPRDCVSFECARVHFGSIPARKKDEFHLVPHETRASSARFCRRAAGRMPISPGVEPGNWMRACHLAARRIEQPWPHSNEPMAGHGVRTITATARPKSTASKPTPPCGLSGAHHQRHLTPADPNNHTTLTKSFLPGARINARPVRLPQCRGDH
jgi:hypothetical protein